MSEIVHVFKLWPELPRVSIMFFLSDRDGVNQIESKSNDQIKHAKSHWPTKSQYRMILSSSHKFYLCPCWHFWFGARGKHLKLLQSSTSFLLALEPSIRNWVCFVSVISYKRFKVNMLICSRSTQSAMSGND